MQILKTLSEIEEWIARKTSTPPLQTHPMLPDEMPALLGFVIFIMFVVTVTCGEYCAK